MIRVLVCDRAPAAARLRRLLEYDRTIEVVATPTDAQEALALVPALDPDLLAIGVDLAGMGGLRAVEQVMATHPLPVVVVGDAPNGFDWPRAALGAGALDTCIRSTIDALDPSGRPAGDLRRKVCRLASAHVIRHPRARLRAPARSAPLRARPLGAIGIVASTGGPPALRRVIAALPPSFPVPLLVVQHMSTGFTESFTAWLGASGGPPVSLAAPGPLEPGVWIAPDGAHLVLVDGRLDLESRTPATHRPSGDVLLASIADDCGAHAAAVVLSGMGSDGAEGVRRIRAAGGVVIAQDETTSAIFGMPRAAAAVGADAVLPLDEIAPALLDLTTVRA